MPALPAVVPVTYKAVFVACAVAAMVIGDKQRCFIFVRFVCLQELPQLEYQAVCVLNALKISSPVIFVCTVIGTEKLQKHKVGFLVPQDPHGLA